MFEDYPHQLPREEALARARALTEFWDRRLGTRTEWDGYRGHISGRVLGFRVAGSVSVEEDHLRGTLEAGHLGVKLGGRHYLLRKLANYLDPSRSLDELRARVP